MDYPKIGIIVSVKDRYYALDRFLKLPIDYPEDRYDIIIADSSKYKQYYEDPNWLNVFQYHTHYTDHWTKCVNKVINNQVFDYDYLLFLNDDTIFKPELLKVYAAHANENTLLTSRIEGWYCGGALNKLTGKVYHPSVIKGEPEWMTGMGLCVPMKVFDVLEFDEKFPMYFSDADFTLQAKALGYKLAVIPESVIEYDKTESTQKHLKDKAKSLKQSWKLLSDERSDVYFPARREFYKRYCYPTAIFAFYFIFLLKRIKRWLI